MIMPTPDVVATVNGVKYRCESATVWWEIANPLTPPDRVMDGRLRAEVETSDGVSFTGLVIGGTMSEYRTVMTFIDQRGRTVRVEINTPEGK